MKRLLMSAVVTGALSLLFVGPEPEGVAQAARGGGRSTAEGPIPGLPLPLIASPEEQATRALASTSPRPSETPTPVAASRCPADMLEVEGDYCPYLEQRCLRWLDPEQRLRCAEFAPNGPCAGRTQKRHFCIDRFEYPNREGERPVIMKTWYEARDTCHAEGKRLCGDSEWTLACEGQEHLPYPYGFARNAEACNIDKPHPDPDEKAIADPRTRWAEVARLDQRDPSGAREACVSPFGVHDMTGNVDEWVVNESGTPFQSGLKGGYWGPVRTRCRPMTTVHNEQFMFYQIGFRCCGDVAAPGSADSAGASDGAGSGGSGGGGAASRPSATAGGSLAGS